MPPYVSRSLALPFLSRRLPRNQLKVSGWWLAGRGDLRSARWAGQETSPQHFDWELAFSACRASLALPPSPSLLSSLAEEFVTRDDAQLYLLWRKQV